MGIESGDWVRVTSRRGPIVAKAELTERSAPGLVFMAFAFAEAAANLLTIDALDPIAKIPDYNGRTYGHCACTEPAEVIGLLPPRSGDLNNLELQTGEERGIIT